MSSQGLKLRDLVDSQQQSVTARIYWPIQAPTVTIIDLANLQTPLKEPKGLRMSFFECNTTYTTGYSMATNGLSIATVYAHSQEIEGWLDTAIDRVVEEIGHAFGKHPLDKDGSIIVNGTVELPYDIFKRLRSREWLNCWDIAAALEMTDRPVFVRLGLSIPLHEEDENSKVTPISKPFGRWRNQIDDYRREGKNDQVHLCPLNINANHFTLLEINEQTKTISHYDSIASRKTKSTPIRRAVEVSNLDGKFKDGANLL
jgi:hypothetical protein